MKKLITFCAVLFFSNFALADYDYQKISQNNLLIHAVTIPHGEYEIASASANKKGFGRKKIGEIAKENDAIIAINAGFFQIGDWEDGRPTGTLINNGDMLGMRISRHGCLVKRNGRVDVDIVTPYIAITIDNKTIKPKRYNRKAHGRHVFYFNDRWGKMAVSKKSANRKEITLNKDLVIKKVSSHGGSVVPESGHVISFPVKYNIDKFKIGKKIKLKWHPDYFNDKNSFAVMGLPILIMNNKYIPNLNNTRKAIRTAAGVKKNNDLVLVVIENAQLEKGPEESNLVDLIKNSDLDYGVTPFKLARIMKNLGCKSAINLDGGGSSSLYINGRYVNTSIGDVDESLGQFTVRPVSDAIIIKEK